MNLSLAEVCERTTKLLGIPKRCLCNFACGEKHPVSRRTAARITIAMSTPLSASTKHTHNCMHGELSDRRAAPVLMTPQGYGADVAPHGSPRRAMQEYGGFASWGDELFPKYEPKASGRKPLRIYFDVSKLERDPGLSCFSYGETFTDEKGKKKRCGWNDVITSAKREMLSAKLLTGAGAFFSELLSVRRVVGPLRIRSSTCGFDNGVQVPQWMRDDGVPETDFVIFLTMRPINSYETVAFAGHCEQDQTGRPTAAQFNWAPSQMSATSSAFMIDYYTRIVHVARDSKRGPLPKRSAPAASDRPCSTPRARRRRCMSLPTRSSSRPSSSPTSRRRLPTRRARTEPTSSALASPTCPTTPAKCARRSRRRASSVPCRSTSAATRCGELCWRTAAAPAPRAATGR